MAPWVLYAIAICLTIVSSGVRHAGYEHLLPPWFTFVWVHLFGGAAVVCVIYALHPTRMWHAVSGAAVLTALLSRAVGIPVAVAFDESTYSWETARATVGIYSLASVLVVFVWGRARP